MQGGWRWRNEKLMDQHPSQYMAMLGSQYDIISDTQRIEGFGFVDPELLCETGRNSPFRWDLVFSDCSYVAPTKGNPAFLIQYLFDVSALRRKSGNHWKSLDEMGVSTLGDIRELNPLLPNPPFNPKPPSSKRRRK